MDVTSNDSADAASNGSAIDDTISISKPVEGSPIGNSDTKTNEVISRIAATFDDTPQYRWVVMILVLIVLVILTALIIFSVVPKNRHKIDEEKYENYHSEGFQGGNVGDNPLPKCQKD